MNTPSPHRQREEGAQPSVAGRRWSRHSLLLVGFFPLIKTNPGRWGLGLPATCLRVPGLRAGHGSSSRGHTASTKTHHETAGFKALRTEKVNVPSPGNAQCLDPNPRVSQLRRETSRKKTEKKTLKNNQTEAERQVRGCYRKARYKSVKTTLQTQPPLRGLSFQEPLQPGGLGTAGRAPGTHRCHRLGRRRGPPGGLCP